MALKLKSTVKEVTNKDRILAYDSTQNYIDGSDAGWGQLGNPNRQDRALLVFCTYIDEDSNYTYLEQENYLVGSNKNFAIANGNGMSNTDMSEFSIESPEDGHHIINTFVLEKDTTRVGGSSGDLYYNVDNGLAYYNNGSVWVEITDSLLPIIEDFSVNTKFQYLLIKRIYKRLTDATRDVYSVRNGYDQDLRQMRDDYSARMFNAVNAFNEGNESSARVLVYNLKNFRFSN